MVFEIKLREQALQNALDSFKLESLYPSDENLAEFRQWLDGEADNRQLMASANEIWQRARSVS